MAIGWLTVLKMVPWGDVIENAPKVAQGARKLWSTVGKKSPPEVSDAASPDDTAQTTLSAQESALAGLQTQVTTLQIATAELHQQMLESSVLIQSLAEQNTQLIQRLELTRKRMLALFLLTLVLGVMLLKLYFW